MSNYNWNYPTTIWVGKDRIKDLYLACSNLNIRNPLFVTDNTKRYWLNRTKKD